MNISTAMVWKEWRETSVYLYIGLIVFLVIPAAAALEDRLMTGHRFVMQVSLFVIVLGGVLAVLTAVGTTCRDLKAGLEDFWQSQPVNVLRWMLTKYLVGLAVVLAGCLVPVAIEYAVNSRADISPDVLFEVMSFLWVAVYTLSFAAGCLLRRPAAAAMMGLVAMLLLYFVPMVLPPLGWMAIPGPTIGSSFDWQWIAYVAGMLCIAAVALGIALVSVKRGWQIQSGTRVLYSAIAGAVLLLMACGSYQLGTNLPVLQTIDLPKDSVGRFIECENNHGFVALMVTTHPGSVERWDNAYVHFEVTPDRGTLNPALLKATDGWFFRTETSDAAGTAYQYQVDTEDAYKGGRLRIVVHSKPRDGAPVQIQSNVKLWDVTQSSKEMVNHFVWGNRLYVVNLEMGKEDYWSLPFRTPVTIKRLMTLDISDRASPLVLSDQFSAATYERIFPMGEQMLIPLPAIPGLSAKGRLDMVLSFDGLLNPRDEDSDVFGSDEADSLSDYRLTLLTSDKAVYKRISSYEESIVDRAFHTNTFGRRIFCNGRLYEQRQIGGSRRSLLYVYDTRGKSMKLIGHYAVPEAAQFCPLADGRVLLVSEQKLYMLGAVKRGKD